MKRYYGKDEATGERNVLLWVAPGAVRYDREDVEFLLPWFYDLKEGAYPAEPESGYIGGNRSRHLTRAYYETACQIAEEIDLRLARTGMDRILVERHFCEGLDDDMIAFQYTMEIDEVRRRINSAVSYISSGLCPRWLSCENCGQRDDCRHLRKLEEKGKRRTVYSYKEWVRKRGKEHSRIK